MPAPESCRDPFLVPGLPFSAPELRGMELSGLLVHVMGDLYLPAHGGPSAPSAGTSARMRAAAVLRLAEPVLSGPWVAIGMTAAWVHAGGEAPGVLEASVDRYHRRPLYRGAVALRLEQSGLARGGGADEEPGTDVVTVHGLWCTTVDRTVEDLLRNGPSGTERAAAASLLPRCDTGRLRERFEARRRRPGMAAARGALAELLAAQGPPGGLRGAEGGQESLRCRPAVRYTS